VIQLTHAPIAGRYSLACLGRIFGAGRHERSVRVPTGRR